MPRTIGQVHASVVNTHHLVAHNIVDMAMATGRIDGADAEGSLAVVTNNVRGVIEALMWSEIEDLGAPSEEYTPVPNPDDDAKNQIKTMLLRALISLCEDDRQQAQRDACDALHMMMCPTRR